MKACARVVTRQGNDGEGIDIDIRETVPFGRTLDKKKHKETRERHPYASLIRPVVIRPDHFKSNLLHWLFGD
jgi:hypothetical protein